jgi:hypothetical protein
MSQPDAWRMIRRRRGAAAGIAAENPLPHFPALESLPTLPTARRAHTGNAAHERPRMAMLYDRMRERLTQDESREDQAMSCSAVDDFASIILVRLIYS